MARRVGRWWGFAAALLALLPLYICTLQTIPNGAEHYFMIDVGETQTVLNVWGTLHATGYPLYVMLSAALVSLLRLIGVSAAAAPAIVSLLYLLMALALVYALLLRLNVPPLAAAAALAAFGAQRTVWIHAVIAEIYSFGLLLLALLLWIALRPGTPARRIYGLALLGGLAVFFHRALLLAAPALVYAVWPQLSARPLRRAVGRVALCLLIGLAGFLPYLYLPLRGQAGAEWVYGQPDTWDGFWDQFWGREAERFIGAPDSWDGLCANVAAVTGVIVTDATLPGLALGLAGLLLALRQPARRRAALTLLLTGGAAYGFHALLYTDILSALILPVNLSLAAGWALLAADLQTMALPRRRSLRLAARLAPAALLLLAAALVGQHAPFIHALTTDPTGLETIALAESAPPGSALMLAWGPRYFAAGFARSVWGRLGSIRLLDHRADYAAALAAGELLVTPAYTFYNQPVSWWEARLGAPVFLSAAAPYLVRIQTQPEIAPDAPAGLAAASEAVICAPDQIALHVAWVSGAAPERDLSVFVHLLDAAGALLAQGDQAAPVYGWRPLTTWQAGEIVRDVYPLARLPGAAVIRYGLYFQDQNGEFVHVVEQTIPVPCEPLAAEPDAAGGLRPGGG